MTPREVARHAARFPRATAMLEIMATAAMLRRAAGELEALVGEAHRTEVGTLRRRARGVLIEALHAAGEL